MARITQLEFDNPNQTYTAKELVEVLEYSYLRTKKSEGASPYYSGYEDGLYDLVTTLIFRLKNDSIRGVEIPK